MSFVFLTDVRPRPRLLVTSALALALVALPVGMNTDGPFLDGKSALAKNDNGNGNAGGNGKGHGKGRGGGHGGLDDEDLLLHRGHGQDRGQGTGGPHDLNEFVDGVRTGKAFGLERHDERIAAAKERYQGALGKHDASVPDEETVAYGFTSEETETLIGRGWKGRAAGEDGFRNHGERTRTMVELSKQLGYGARVGAMQANFGTPYENGIAELWAEIAATDDPEEAKRLEGDLAVAIERAKPGNGPDDSWATANLDVNGDHVVDGRDLEALASADDDDEPPAEDDEQLAENR